MTRHNRILAHFQHCSAVSSLRSENLFCAWMMAAFTEARPCPTTSSQQIQRATVMRKRRQNGFISNEPRGWLQRFEVPLLQLVHEFMFLRCLDIVSDAIFHDLDCALSQVLTAAMAWTGSGAPPTPKSCYSPHQTFLFEIFHKGIWKITHGQSHFP